MFKKILLVVLFICFCNKAQAWDERHALWTVSTVSILADWGTTLDIDCSKGYFEKNPFMGKCPSRFEVNRYFTGILVLHGLTNWTIQQIPYPKVRRFLTWTENVYVIYEHGGAAYNNFELGLKVNF